MANGRGAEREQQVDGAGGGHVACVGSGTPGVERTVRWAVDACWQRALQGCRGLPLPLRWESPVESRTEERQDVLRILAGFC